MMTFLELLEHVREEHERRLVAYRRWGHPQRLTTSQRVELPRQRVPPVSVVKPRKDEQ